MTSPSLDAIRSFLAVAELRSFTAAAARLDVTPAAASKAVRTLEQEHGVTLFRRSTRSVALTEPGELLYADLVSATAQIDDAFARLHAHRDEPVGTLRLTVPRALGAIVLARLVPRFRRAYPQVKLDLSLDDGTVDLIAQGYDAGIRLGQQVEQDMVAVRLTPDLAWSVVAAPAYLDKAGRPREPEELVRHETIRYRFHTSGALHRWRFSRGEASFDVDTGNSLVVNDTTLIAEFARAGLGLAYMANVEIEDDLAAGRLEQVLEPFVPATTGLYLYFPSRTQSQRKLRAFIDLAREMC